MRDIQIFKNEDFGEIRVVMNEQSEPMFCLSDVCKALELKNPSDVKTRLSAKGVAIADTLTAGGVQSMTYINEANLYKCIFQSRKPEAEKFQDWVYEEVLPSIRKHGAYMTQTVIERTLTDPDYLIQLATTLKEERQKRIAAETKIEADAPKVLFAEAVETSDSVCLVGELAKILKQNGIKDMGQNRLYKWLRSHCYLGNKGDNYNLPTQKAMDLGVFKVTKGKRIDRHTGGVIVTRTAKVTVKGLKYFINKFMNTAAVL